ncbi:unnamed protein product [Caenorhabditis angaria]|uniref:G-protein coupled receptors family 1 profile domain-containing protein n=1 Tax=Caenorhabditis angaria TaxID=860376 RepID=A0A9P1MWM4_9PELO|nr:unnamed protein product [Caenorhabditis angaria]
MDLTRQHRMHHNMKSHNKSINTFQKCALANENGDIPWYSLQSTITLLNLSAIFANIFFMFVCRKAGVMHKNTSAMLATISFCFAVNASAGLLYNIYFFYIGFFGFTEYPIHSNWCSLINSLMVPWDVATCVLMVGVGSERLIATKKHMPSGTISGYVKGIFIFDAFAAIMVTVNYVMNLTDQGVCICDGASLAERRSMFIRIFTCAIVETGTISLFGYVHILSRNKADSLGINTAKYCLSQRFQIYETYRTTHMLLPSAVLHAILYLSYLCLLIPIRDLRAEPNLTLLQFNLSTIIFTFPSIHALAHPLICMSRHYYLRNRVSEMLRNTCSSRLPDIAHQTEQQRQHLTTHKTTPEMSSNHSFRSDCARVEFRIAPEKHAEILESFWETKKS